MKKLAAEEARLVAAEQLATQRVNGKRTAWEQALADWREQVRVAHLAGKEPPSRPADPDYGGDENVTKTFFDAKQELDRRRKATLAGIAAEVEEAAVEVEVRLLAEERKLAAALQKLASEHHQLLVAVRTVRGAADTADPDSRPIPGTADRTRQTIDAHDVLDAVATGGSLLALLPVEWHGQVVEEHDGYALTPGRPFGTPPKMVPPRSQRRIGEI
jgi:hypothetical protein